MPLYHVCLANADAGAYAEVETDSRPLAEGIKARAERRDDVEAHIVGRVD